MIFCRRLALERSGWMSSLGDKVKIELPLFTLLTGRQFMTEVMTSTLWIRSTEYRLEFSNVSNCLNTLIEDSTKFECCSPPALGRMLRFGHGLWWARETNVWWASVTISKGWENFRNRTCREVLEISVTSHWLEAQRKSLWSNLPRKGVTGMHFLISSL